MSNSYLITGTTSGLGEKLKLLLISKGNNVISINRIGTVNKDNNYDFNLDITSYSEVFSFLKKLNDEGRVPKYFILNAGINLFDNQKYFSVNNFKSCFDINFYGVMNFVGAIEELAVKNKCFIYISSTSNIIPNPAALGYFSSKYLIDKISNYFSKENDHKVVILGPVLTNISRKIGPPKGIAKILFNFLAIDSVKSAEKIYQFILSNKKKLYFTKKSIIVYWLIKIILIFFPNIYKGGKN